MSYPHPNCGNVDNLPSYPQSYPQFLTPKKRPKTTIYSIFNDSQPQYFDFAKKLSTFPQPIIIIILIIFKNIYMK